MNLDQILSLELQRIHSGKRENLQEQLAKDMQLLNGQEQIPADQLFSVLLRFEPGGLYENNGEMDSEKSMLHSYAKMVNTIGINPEDQLLIEQKLQQYQRLVPALLESKKLGKALQQLVRDVPTLTSSIGKQSKLVEFEKRLHSYQGRIEQYRAIPALQFLAQELQPLYKDAATQFSITAESYVSKQFEILEGHYRSAVQGQSKNLLHSTKHLLEDQVEFLNQLDPSRAKTLGKWIGDLENRMQKMDKQLNKGTKIQVQQQGMVEQALQHYATLQKQYAEGKISTSRRKKKALYTLDTIKRTFEAYQQKDQLASVKQFRETLQTYIPKKQSHGLLKAMVAMGVCIGAGYYASQQYPLKDQIQAWQRQLVETNQAIDKPDRQSLPLEPPKTIIPHQVYSVAETPSISQSRDASPLPVTIPTQSGSISKPDIANNIEGLEPIELLPDMDLIPESVLAMQTYSSSIIYVDKKNNILHLYQNFNGHLSEIASYATTDGSGGKGAKTMGGDKKTPEGVYHFTFMQKEGIDYQHDPLFGSMKLGLSYPNTIDSTLGRSGAGILICGTDINSRNTAIRNKQDSTNGGVVLLNTDLDALVSRINASTLVILEDPDRPLDRNQYKQMVSTWKLHNNF